ncbi:MAG: hypothetical protein A3G34_07110 [Candidatus Lindowbacteria bacterium RIFCSPLOWO2_12_FULL_62_27]|nr:MAG: hypothetical protein A3G34_07110 [Candidatus Lindowbacteria bacterium RIFCSPLOWO2_12_FULL_62_27]OGH61803.1 MAG: hypothetical protein A3I06_09295 [Candidatus Lindowbacteria bacterium RIFCSPLOWO2_02_FULL_62_12]
MKIEWVEWEAVPQGLGHGIEIHDLKRAMGNSLIAFVHELEWTKNNMPRVTVYRIHPDDVTTAGDLKTVRRLVDAKIKKGEIFHDLSRRFRAQPNA